MNLATPARKIFRYLYQYNIYLGDKKNKCYSKLKFFLNLNKFYIKLVLC